MQMYKIILRLPKDLQNLTLTLTFIYTDLDKGSTIA